MTAAAPLNAENAITSRIGTPSTNVPMATIAPTIRPTIAMMTRSETEPLEEADPRA